MCSAELAACEHCPDRRGTLLSFQPAVRCMIVASWISGFMSCTLFHTVILGFEWWLDVLAEVLLLGDSGM